jgi:hypothetical protein
MPFVAACGECGSSAMPGEEVAMKKPMDPNRHAVLDYMMGATCLTIPSMAGFNVMSSVLSYGIGITQLGLSMVTNYPASVAKVVPFKVHGLIELGTGIGMVALAFMPKVLDKKAKIFFFNSGISTIGLYLMTDYSQQAVQQAELEFAEFRHEAIDQVEHVAEQMHVPEPVLEVLRKAS